MPFEHRRKTPDELLCEVEAEEAGSLKTGHLKIVLGYASGVGKTFRLLDEARRRHDRGQDIVVGAVQPNLPPEVAPLLKDLEIIPLKQFGGGMAVDVETIMRRHPMVCYIDGLAYDNPPGAPNPTRWQDVGDLLKGRIKVVASINIQYIGEMRDRVAAITGKRATEAVPIAFINSASEIEIVDAPPPEERMEHSPEEELKTQEREQRLSRLRELALVLTADVVDHQLNAYLECHGIHQQLGVCERILVCVTPRANLKEMIEAARIVTERAHGELIVAYVKQPNISREDQAALDSKLAMAGAAGARIEILDGDDPSEALLQFAQSRSVTQLFVGHSRRTGLARLKGSPLDKLIWQGHGMDVRVFPQQQ